MHGLVNRALQSFLRETYGGDHWAAIAASSGVGPDGFEAMLSYDDAVTEAVLRAAEAQLAKPRDALFEDLGTFLVSREALRRLLRFGGANFDDFLLSLDDLPGRVRLAVPDLDFPALRVVLRPGGRLRLRLSDAAGGLASAYGGVLAGLLRAMADDYGALAVIEVTGRGRTSAEIGIELLEGRFAEGRRFDLARPAQARSGVAP